MAAEDVARRRLQPIYDALETENYKQAIQISDKMLKKDPNNLTTKALKALALRRSGKGAEGLALVEEVRGAHPKDSSTLQAMEFTYKDLRKYELNMLAYEKAVELDASNEENANHLLTSYIRLDHLDKVQNLAGKMAKQFNKPVYKIWSVLAILGLARRPTNAALAEKLYIPLAVKLMDTLFSENSLNTCQSLMFYLHLLESRGKVEECLSIIRGPSAKLLQPEKLKYELEVDLVAKTASKENLQALHEALVRKDPENWRYWTRYFDVVLEVDPSGAKSTIRNLIDEMIGASGAGSEKSRGPYLARLEWASRFATWSDVWELLVAYIETFGSKLCCFADIKLYLNVAPVAEYANLCSQLPALEERTCARVTSDTAKVYISICIEKIRRSLHAHEIIETNARKALIADLRERYRSALPLGEKLDVRERQHSDDFLLMAIHILLDGYAQAPESNQALLADAVTLLKEGLTKSKYNFQFQLLLMRIYNMAGAADMAYDAYVFLDVKYVQNDSLSFFMLDYAYLSGNSVLAERVTSSVLDFFGYSSKDIMENGIIKGFLNQSYDKVEEFYRFRNKNERSLSKAVAELEHFVVNFMLYNAFTPQEAKAYLLDTKALPTHERLSDAADNRDQTVADLFESSSHAPNARSVAALNNAHVEFLHAKLASLLAVSAILKEPTSAVMQEALSSLQSRSVVAATASVNLERTFKPQHLVIKAPAMGIYGPAWSHLEKFLECLVWVSQLTKDWTATVAEVAPSESQLMDIVRLSEQFKSIVRSFCDLLQSATSGFVAERQLPLPILGVHLEKLTITLEVLTLICVLLANVGLELVLPSSLSRKAKKRVIAGGLGLGVWNALQEPLGGLVDVLTETQTTITAIIATPDTGSEWIAERTSQKNSLACLNKSVQGLIALLAIARQSI